MTDRTDTTIEVNEMAFDELLVMLKRSREAYKMYADGTAAWICDRILTELERMKK